MAMVPLRFLRLVLLAFLMLWVQDIISQELSTQNNRAARNFRAGAREFDLRNYQEAMRLFKQAISSDKGFYEAYLMTGEVYFALNDFRQAVAYYEKAVSINPDFFPMIYYNMGNAWMALGSYEEAKKAYRQLAGHPEISPGYRTLARKKIESCLFAIDAMANPVPFDPVDIGESINSSNDEYWPTLTADEQILIFTRQTMVDPAGRRVPANLREDFYISYFDENGWSKAAPIGPPLGSELNEGAPSVTADGSMIFFTACNRADGLGSCDIYFARREGKKWGEPVNIGRPVNSSAWEAQPSISPDGNTLYFSSNRNGGQGRMDIWYSERGPDGNWQTPVNLGKTINTAGNEMSPFIHVDNQTLYFSSDGHTGMGGYDLYLTRRDSTGNWSEPDNLGYPLNTHFDEIGLIVNARGDKGYFSSNRMSGEVRDIYFFELHPVARPREVSYMKGTVYDADTRQRLRASFELIDLYSSELLIRAYSDPLTGEFLVPLVTGGDYALNVSREGYLFYSDHFSMSNFAHQTDPFLKDVPLHPISAGEKTILRNIFFEFDSYELKSESIVELERMTRFMKDNPGIFIRINGHTDNIGDPSYNMELSEKRAERVAAFLIDSGISSERVRHAGFGETMPVASNQTEEGRAENRRTEFEIIEP
jgi:flagellar motor protein MotB